MNWLKNLWNWLKSLFNGSSEPIEPYHLPPKPKLTDAEYESVLFALLEEVKKGKSWGSCQGILINRNVKPDELAAWIEEKSVEWLQNKDNYQQLGEDLGELGDVASGKLGNIATKLSSEFGVRGSELGNFQGDNLQNTELNSTPSETQNLNPSQTTTDEVQRLIDQAIEQYQRGEYQEAVNTVVAVTQQHPNDYGGWWFLGELMYSFQQYEQAIASVDEVLEIKSDLYQAWFNRGLALGNLEKYEEAIASYDKALEIKLDYVGAWYNRGFVLYSLGRYDEAITSWDKVLEIKPDDHEAWYSRGFALKDLGRYDEAITSWDKVLEIKPDNHEAWFNRGIALVNLGRFDEAIASWDKVLEIKPNNHEAWFNRGIALDDLGKLNEAISSYDKALEIKPDNHEAWSNRGNALHDLRRFEEAIASYDKALEFQPSLHIAWYGRGKAASKSIANEREIIRVQSQFIEIFTLNLTNASTQLINYFQFLETEDFCDLISFLQQPNSDKLIQFLNQSQLQSISRLNPELNKRGYEGELISYRYPLNKHIYQDSHPKGWGDLHYQIGLAQYKHQEHNNAINSYHCALETLTVEQFPELRLEVIQDLVKVYLAVRDKDNADDYLLQGLKLLNQLLDKVPVADENQRLRLEAKFLTFRQLTVNVLLEKGEIIEALRNAELEKNRRLTHILEGYKTENQLQTNSNIYPSYEQIQTLLNECRIKNLECRSNECRIKNLECRSNECRIKNLECRSNEFRIKNLECRNKAIIYWFNSPMGLITFILTQEKAPLIKGGLGGSNLEQWIKEWDEDYQDYRSKKDTETEDKKAHSWRIKISDRLETLKEILGISEIENDLQDIEELILIPHQDLHRLPLHSLFNQKNWTISYLPSLQIGLNLKQKQEQLNNNQIESLLNIENPRKDLVFSEIESAIVNTYFATIETSVTTIEDFKNAIPNHTHLHFTGHGYYHFDDPKRSALEFVNNSLLTAYEINQLNFNSYQLITLAACETALNGNQTIDSEYVGLVSAFMKGGANCVLSTLWTVDETSSAWLMIYFYQQYRAGIPPKIALKNAQDWLKTVSYDKLIIWLNQLLEDTKYKEIDPNIIELIQDEINKCKQENANHQPYENPYFWLSFIVHQF
ncbi:tetratricopeptide repeat protein [Cyanothece sp. BG0011]|uniref:CHAT domain-containing protein n=1 Tax=Cyanothece sp. BG0011 TaxID=2082950 RepID=UPI000D1EF06D|nr:CHAT domain-containing protein [Cyanothece sp. BG0011]